MSVSLTSNFLLNARGLAFGDGGGIVWSFNKNTNAITASGPLSSVSVTDSITGSGTSLSPLQLSGDASVPGNSFYYGTNVSGTRGWYASTAVPTVANPSGTIGLSAVIGATGHWMDAGSAPVLSQGITPTWSGKHSYSVGGDFASSGATGLSIDAQKWQDFCIQFTNTAGVIQHAIVNNPLTATASSYADKISGASAVLANTPTAVSTSVGLTNGVGLLSGANFAVILGTADQSTGKANVQTSVEYYDGNAQRVRVFGGFISRNVNGVTITRLELRVVDDMTAAGAAVNATLLPAGKSLFVRISGYLL